MSNKDLSLLNKKLELLRSEFWSLRAISSPSNYLSKSYLQRNMNWPWMNKSIYKIIDDRKIFLKPGFMLASDEFKNYY